MSFFDHPSSGHAAPTAAPAEPSARPSIVSPPAPAPTAEDRIAAALFNEPPPRNPYATGLYDAPLEQVHASAAREIERAAEVLAIEPGAVPAIKAEWVDTFGRYGLNGDESTQMVDLGRAALARAGAVTLALSHPPAPSPAAPAAPVPSRPSRE